MSPTLSRHWVRFALAGAVALAGGATIVGTVGAETVTPTMGRIPPDARGGNGHVNMAAIPDYVSVLNADGGRAGYVAKTDLFGRDKASFPVYDSALEIVGTWVSGRGFVPNGVDSDDVPEVITTQRRPGPNSGKPSSP